MSYDTPLNLAEATVGPGFMTRRVRWEKSAETTTGSLSAYLEKAYTHAKNDFSSVIEAFRKQLSQPLAPREAVVLLGCERIGKIGERLTVIEDAAGNRLEAADRRKDYSNAANLLRAAGMLVKDKPAVLVRLFVQPMSNTLVALPLAAITAKHHIRLGL